MAKWVAPLVVGGLIGFAARDESRTMRRAGFKAKKDRVSSCISGKVRGEGWDQRQAVAACLSMQEQGRLRADGSYIRKGRRAKHEEILRSSFGAGRGGTKIFLTYDRATGQYVVRSRFQDFYRSRKGLKPNSAEARAALKRAEDRFETRLLFTPGGTDWKEHGRRAKHSKRAFVKQVWERQAPTIRGEPLPPPIPGMEGPFRFRSGKILYYDPKEGAYYDRGSDLYVTVDEVEAAMSGRLWWDR